MLQCGIHIPSVAFIRHIAREKFDLAQQNLQFHIDPQEKFIPDTKL
jgi:hypothetical protein